MFSRLLNLSILVAVGHGAAISKRLDNGLGVTPAMGWNNWNSQLPPTAQNALNTANAFINLGLKDLGYNYVNLDDGWSTRSRDSNGNLVADPAKFPDGMPALVNKIHSMGLKFGLYGDSGTATCAGYPGSQGYEAKDAALLSAWKVDYWKYDNCNTPSGNSQPRYAKMRDLLLAQSHDILYSLCQWGYDSVWTWGAGVGNSWRVGGDISNNWNSMAAIAANNAGIANYSQSGGFNDFDMMEIGNGGLTEAEERTHFGLWAISKSPLLLGCDMTKIPATSVAIIKNKAVIAINQDPLGRAATTFQPSGASPPTSGQLYPYWSGPLSDGYVIGLVATTGATTLSVNFADVPGLGAGSYSWTEAYSGRTGSGTSVRATLGLHDMAIFRIKTVGGGGDITVTRTITTSSSEVTTRIPTSDTDVTTRIPTSDTDVTTRIPTSDTDVTTRTPISVADVTTRIPTSDTDVTTRIPTSDTDVTTRIPTSDTDVTTRTVTSATPTLTRSTTTERPTTTRTFTLPPVTLLAMP